MGWWEDLSGAVSDADDTAAGVVQAVLNATGDAVTDFLETAGNAAADTALGVLLNDDISDMERFPGHPFSPIELAKRAQRIGIAIGQAAYRASSQPERFAKALPRGVIW